MAKSAILQSAINEGSYGHTLFWSLIIHVSLITALTLLPRLIPAGSPLLLGTGPGGGSGGETIAVGLVDDRGGGAGQYKPSLTAQPPAVETPKPEEKANEESNADAFEIVKKPQKQQEKEKPKEAPKVPRNYIPIETGPGAGGSGGSGGSGGGFGGGSGVQIGSGSGGLGDSWYARQVERRIGENWLKSLMGDVQGQYQTIISFYIRDNGTIVDITLERSSGVASLDLSARRAIEASNPLAALPYELRGRPVKFTAYFVYPPPR